MRSVGTAADSRGRGAVASRWLRGTASLGAAILLIAVALPAMSGLGWSQLDRERPRSAPPARAPDLALDRRSLDPHGGVDRRSTGAEPPRALTLSLTGSAVSNVTPLGGALGVGLNYRMTRVWARVETNSRSTRSSRTLCDVLAKLIVPVVIVTVLVAAQAPGTLPHGGSVVALCGLFAAAVTVGTLLVSDSSLPRRVSPCGAPPRSSPSLLRRPRTIDAASILETRSASWTIMRARWKSHASVSSATSLSWPCCCARRCLSPEVVWWAGSCSPPWPLSDFSASLS